MRFFNAYQVTISCTETYWAVHYDHVTTVLHRGGAALSPAEHLTLCSEALELAAAYLDVASTTPAGGGGRVYLDASVAGGLIVALDRYTNPAGEVAWRPICGAMHAE